MQTKEEIRKQLDNDPDFMNSFCASTGISKHGLETMLLVFSSCKVKQKLEGDNLKNMLQNTHDKTLIK